MATDTKAYWAKQVKRWTASRQTLRDYSASTGLGASSLKNWKWKLGVEAKRPTAVPSFVDVSSAVSMSSREVFEVVLLDGVVVRVPMSFDGPALATLLDLVRKAKA